MPVKNTGGRMGRGASDTTGKRIRLLRQELGMRQEDVAGSLQAYGVDINRSYVSNLENGDRAPSSEVLAGLARTFKTTTDYLLLLTDDPLTPEQRESGQSRAGGTADDWLALGERLEGLSPVKRKHLVDAFASLIDLLLAQQPASIKDFVDQLPGLDERGRGLVSALLSAAERELLDDEDLAAIESEVEAFVEERRSKARMMSAHTPGRSSSSSSA